jgi:hypothetical protein
MGADLSDGWIVAIAVTLLLAVTKYRLMKTQARLRMVGDIAASLARKFT